MCSESQKSNRGSSAGSNKICVRYRVEWDFWTSANDGCGNACDRQASFKVAMRETAQTLEKVTRYSRDCLTKSHQAASQCPILLHLLARPRLLPKELQFISDQETWCH